LNRNSKLALLSTDSRNGWYHVARGSQKGWIQGNAIKIVDDLPNLDEYDLWKNGGNPWIYYTSSTDEKYYFNAKLITRAGSHISAWSKSESKMTGNLDDKTLFEFECQTRRYRVVSLTAYEADGSVRRSIDNPNAPYGFIVPDSVAEALYDAVCKK
jgi:uncharacterized protein YgiM (DUF1202 family)